MFKSFNIMVFYFILFYKIENAYFKFDQKNLSKKLS